MKKLAVLAMAGLMSVTASASNWVLVAENTEDDKAYVDTDTIVNSGNFGNYKKAFVRYDFNEIKTSFLGDYDSMMSLEEFDCDRPIRVRRLSLVRRLNQISVYQDNKPNVWNTVYPDTIGETLGNFVCSYKK